MKNISSNIKSKHFNNYGYEIIRSGLNNEYLIYENLMAEYFSKSLSEYLCKDIVLDKMSNYNEIANNNELDHHGFIASISRKLPLDFHETDFIKNIINHCEKFIGKKLKIVDNLVWFRICRPGFDDSNDLHRDHWFPNYNDVLNLYIPISGSYCDSAMKIVPKSYSWSDKDVIPTFSGDSGQKYVKNGVAYSAPGIKYSKFDIIPHRPDISLGDFMIFHPKSIHGGGDNFSNETRISIEIRIEL
tara:strand:- start:3782 stop:4513 length:732 start_codon:yes stop_codon:yes gene_type:complete